MKLMYWIGHRVLLIHEMSMATHEDKILEILAPLIPQLEC